MNIMMNIALTNLGKYNEGELIYKWLTLPATEEEIDEAMKEIGIDDHYEEFFISDYECDYYEIGEYENLETLNEIAEQVENLDDYDAEIVKALLAEGYDLKEAIDKSGDCVIYYDCDDMSDVAYSFYEEGILGEIPEHLVNYIDWEAYGRDIKLDGNFIRLDEQNAYLQIF